MTSTRQDTGIVFSHEHDSNKDEKFLTFRNTYLKNEYYRFKECLRQIEATLSNVSYSITVYYIFKHYILVETTNIIIGLLLFV